MLLFLEWARFSFGLRSTFWKKRQLDVCEFCLHNQARAELGLHPFVQSPPYSLVTRISPDDKRLVTVGYDESYSLTKSLFEAFKTLDILL